MANEELTRYLLQLYRCPQHGTMCRQAGQNECPGGIKDSCGNKMQAMSDPVEAMLPKGRVVVRRCMHRPGVYLNVRGKRDGDGYLEVGPEAWAVIPSGPAASGGWPIPDPVPPPEPEPAKPTPSTYRSKKTRKKKTSARSRS